MGFTASFKVKPSGKGDRQQHSWGGKRCEGPEKPLSGGQMVSIWLLNSAQLLKTATAISVRLSVPIKLYSQNAVHWPLPHTLHQTSGGTFWKAAWA